MKSTFLTLALAGSLVLAGQASATDVLQDDDLDRMTAAGDPVVIKSEGGTLSQVAYNEDTAFTLNIPKDAQVGLRALTIQNVVGELQLLVNLNVLSAQNSVAGTDQRNFSLQSWGSTLPDSETIKTATASASANAACSVAFACAAAGGTATGGGGAVGAIGGTNTATVTSTISSPTGGTNSISAQANQTADGGAGGAGGAATANAAANSGIIKGNGSTSTSAVVGGTLGSASGDVIIVSKSQPTGVSTVAFDNAAKYGLSFESGAQTNLSALFISNVVGRAQMALNLNIAAAGLNLTPGSGDSFATPVGSTGPGLITQVNTGLQFRGTPLVGASGMTGTFNTSITHVNQ